jgi:pilus assembly protein FimV
LKKNPMISGRFALTAMATAALCLGASGAWALGLGKLKVQSALGESLRAEIDVTSLSPEEASNLRVRIAPPEAYRTAGVDYNAVLPATQAVLLRRNDGSPYLKITSDRGVQEPFVDVILELNWATGRLVREYTLLFDPPITARTPVAAAAVTPVAISAAKPVTESPVITESVEPARRIIPNTTPRVTTERRPTAPTRSTAKNAAAPREGKAVTRSAAKSGPAGAGEYKVKPGDSLSRIATRTQRGGVSLDQMLVSLYRGNPQAFIDNNMNRLKSGAVLSVPSAEEAKALSAADANQVIQAQSANFGAYRNRLAGGVLSTKTEGNSRQTSGKVQASVDDRQKGVATSPDKLTLSKGSSGASAPNPVDKVAAQKAEELRAAELAKNVTDLTKLAGATATAQAAASSVAATAPKVVASVASAAVSVVPTPSPAASALLPAMPAPVVVATAPAAPASVVVMPPPEPITPVASAVVAPPPVLAPEPVIAKTTPTPTSAPPVSTAALDSGSMFGDNGLAFGLGGLALALAGGYAGFRYLKRVKKDSGETSFLESRLQPDSFFGASGGQRIDTRDAGGASSSMSYSLSQLDAIGDVDPVAEADVYLAYGRDLQAEEILKEAMRSSPDRMAIRTKLLEVYAKRRDTKGFELLATQLFTLTQGKGEDWAKAQELGAQIDPENPMFQDGGAPAAPATARQISDPLGASTLPQSTLSQSTLSPHSVSPTASKFDNVSTTRLPAIDSGLMDLDLDLDLNGPTAAKPAAAATAAAAAKPNTGVIDFTVSGHHDDPHSRDTIPSQLDESDTLDLASLHLTGADVQLGRKLELAEEFRQIGDKEGAREMMQEVIDKASGPLKSKALSLLQRLG